jgi:hypothetical protein
MVLDAEALKVDRCVLKKSSTSFGNCPRCGQEADETPRTIGRLRTLQTHDQPRIFTTKSFTHGPTAHTMTAMVAQKPRSTG